MGSEKEMVCQRPHATFEVARCLQYDTRISDLQLGYSQMLPPITN